MRPHLLAAALSLAVAAPAAAQKLTIEFHDGRVTVDATAVPVRTILTEWSKLGGTKVIGGDRVAGAPLTVKLIDVPESQALDVILRSVAGYMAAPRNTGAGASIYDRIMVMATSSPPAPAAAARPTAPRNSGMAGTQRFVPPRRGVQQQQDEEEPEDEEDPNPPNPPVFTFPQPGQGFQQPGQFNNGQFNNGQFNGGVVNGQPIIVNPANGQTITVSPAQPGMPTYQPVTPVGLPTPGMIAPVPQQTTPTTPPVITRPPGQQR